MKINKLQLTNKGFTLSEVLITLVIIGIIAAVTIPILINKYMEDQYRSGVNKALSVLNQAAIKYHVDN